MKRGNESTVGSNHIGVYSRASRSSTLYSFTGNLKIVLLQRRYAQERPNHPNVLGRKPYGWLSPYLGCERSGRNDERKVGCHFDKIGMDDGRMRSSTLGGSGAGRLGLQRTLYHGHYTSNSSHSSAIKCSFPALRGPDDTCYTPQILSTVVVCDCATRSLHFSNSSVLGLLAFDYGVLLP